MILLNCLLDVALFMITGLKYGKGAFVIVKEYDMKNSIQSNYVTEST